MRTFSPSLSSSSTSLSVTPAVSLLDLNLLPPPGHSIIPAIVQLNKACVLERKQRRQAENRKATPCRALLESGRCNYGRRCKFAHSETERIAAIQASSQYARRLSTEAQRHYRTLPCLKFSLLGECPYGDSCTYLHGPKVDVEKELDQLLQQEQSGAEEVNSSSRLPTLRVPCSPPSPPSTPDFDPFSFFQLEQMLGPASSFDPFRSPIDNCKNSFEFRPVSLHHPFF